MSTVVEVKLWGTTIGYLGYSQGQTEVSTFEYDKAFVRSNIQISPIKMTYPPNKFEFTDISKRTFKGVAGVFADSLPDKFGNQLIDIFMAEKKKPSDNVTTLDRLLYIGNRSMGALEYYPSQELDDEKNDNILDLKVLTELSEEVLANKKKFQSELSNANRSQALKLIRVGSSAGGARSKALVATDLKGNLLDGTVRYDKGFRYWLLKFDSSSNSDRDSKDPKGMTKIEYIYSEIARECAIDIPKTTFIEDGDDFHFMIERFDRLYQSHKLEKLHYLSWSGLEHADRDTTGTYSYEQLILLVRKLGLGQDSVSEIYKRAIFNIVGKNQDDHTKNFGFLMNKKGEWSVSPAFDLTYSYDSRGKWTKVHQISLNRKQDDFELQDLMEFGKYCNISEKNSKKILDSTIKSFKNFSKLCKKYKVDEVLENTIQDNLRMYFIP
jgi:serine/threonine-protein kinase HipA